MNEFKYMRYETEDEYGIKKLQDKLLEIMVYIDEFCSKYDVDYCLMAGSALGAERHQGFIPWDDDIDIYMSENDYEKFRLNFKKFGDHKKYYLQEWGKTEAKGRHMITTAKVRMNNTIIQEESFVDWNIHQGIFVDIFILHNCSNNKITQKIQYIWTEAVVLKGLAVRGYKSKGKKDSILLTIVKAIPTKWMLKNGLSRTYRYRDKETKFVHGFVDTRKFSRAVFPSKCIFLGKYTQFENVLLKVPANNKHYLSVQFGNDYMTPPPVEQRPINKHSIYWKTGCEDAYYDLSDEEILI